MCRIMGVVLCLAFGSVALGAELPGFRKSAWFDEQVREQWVADGVRVVANANGDFDPKKPTQLVIFATPNGNTIEQTLGCGTAPGIDWHFDIQHVAAQIRKWRSITPNENIVLICTESEGLSWPAWKRKYPDGPARVRDVVEAVKAWIPAEKLRVTLACHSGGGSFLFGYLDAVTEIPTQVDRFLFLDANYSYSDADEHGTKLLRWLKADRSRRLVVIAYDDRKVTFNGKLVVSADGGTYRATERMLTRFAQEVTFTETTTGPFINRIAMQGQLALHVHTNPENRILHTALVGEMNGLLHGLSEDSPKPVWGTFGGPRAYTPFVQPAPGIPVRPVDAIGGKAFFASIDGLNRNDREAAIVKELSRGNIPNFLRTFRAITTRSIDAYGKPHTATYEVMPDYLAIGSDTDFVRVPITPMTAARIADLYGCALPTRKIVDDVHQAATVKLEPRPMTKDRDGAKTFLEHHEIIEQQRAGNKLGELVSGIKKDVVLTNRVEEKANRVAIYGWHKLDGKPIQPLTIVHVNWYVDYSHGVRLMKRTVTIDGRPHDIRPALYSNDLSPLFSDEGPIRYPAY